MLGPPVLVRRVRLLLLAIPLFLWHPTMATVSNSGSLEADEVARMDVAALIETFPSDSLAPRENQRLVAAALALFLGPFGAHRLYFGTTAKVPIIYGITFGGFGILALIDLGHILFTKDLSRYRDCDRVFMWARPKPATTPP